MNNIYSIGINHKTAPIEIREKFYLNEIEQDLFLSEIKNDPSILEGFILSTCNRTEVYVHALNGSDPFGKVLDTLAKVKKISNPESFDCHFYAFRADSAVSHLLRVVTGLDSLVLGEKQILGQVRRSLERGAAHGMFSRHFHILSNIALRTGKKAQAETSISFGGSSVSWAAVVKAEEVLGDLSEKKILLIGAGEMSKLTVGQIQNKNFKKLYIMNRTGCKAEALAEKFGAEAVDFTDMKDVLADIDLCICSAGAPHYILDRAIMDKVMHLRHDRRVVFIDISMPRNIDPSIQFIPHVDLFEIDDLHEVVDNSMKIRKMAIEQVEAMIAEKLQTYQKRLVEAAPGALTSQ